MATVLLLLAMFVHAVLAVAAAFSVFTSLSKAKEYHAGLMIAICSWCFLFPARWLSA